MQSEQESKRLQEVYDAANAGTAFAGIGVAVTVVCLVLSAITLCKVGSLQSEVEWVKATTDLTWKLADEIVVKKTAEVKPQYAAAATGKSEIRAVTVTNLPATGGSRFVGACCCVEVALRGVAAGFAKFAADLPDSKPNHYQGPGTVDRALTLFLKTKPGGPPPWGNCLTNSGSREAVRKFLESGPVVVLSMDVNRMREPVAVMARDGDEYLVWSPELGPRQLKAKDFDYQYLNNGDYTVNLFFALKED